MTKQYSKHTRASGSAFTFGLMTWLSVFGYLLISKPSISNSLPSSMPGFTKPAVSARSHSMLNQLPISFEENRGQVEQAVRFIARQHGYTLYLTDDEARFELKHKSSDKPKTLRVKLASDANKATVEGLGQLSGKSNYFIGNDPREWQTDVPTYTRVTQRGIYPGVDAVFYGNQQQLEYDFIVAPQSDPQQIELAFDGADKLELNEQGDLLVDLSGEQLLMQKPVIYQQVNGQRRLIEGGFSLRDLKSQIPNLKSQIPNLKSQ
ncbi:MAG: hypothetical protein ACRD82_04710, partial [Blastocatellia bacterium]